MQLMTSAASPYARKVRVALHEYGLLGEVEMVTVDAHAAPDQLTRINGLSKIPALDTEDGPVLFDSPVILQWLDETYPDKPRLVPTDGPDRWHTLRRAALADGIMDAAVALVLENRRPLERQHQPAVEKELNRLQIALDMAEREAGGLPQIPRIDTIGLACALEYLAFRLSDQIDWRSGRPDLEQWMRDFCQRDSMMDTRPS